MNPQFNREELKAALAETGIAYVYLGKELGARSEDPDCYEQGTIRYDRLARTALFQSGLDRVEAGADRFTLALMCAEKEPLDCHRTLLVSRQLVARGFAVRHIHADGRLETHDEALDRLARKLGMPEHDMFRSHSDILRDAYELQEARIAYSTGTPRPLARGRGAGG